MSKPEGPTEFARLIRESGPYNPRSSETVPYTPHVQGPVRRDKGLTCNRPISRVSGPQTPELDSAIAGLTGPYRATGYKVSDRPSSTMFLSPPRPPTGPSTPTNRPQTDAAFLGGVA